VPIGVAVSGESSISRFAPLADHLIAVEPKPDLVQGWNGTDGAAKIGEQARAVGQIPICWDPDEDTAVKRAHDQFRWFAGGWSVNSDLPTTAGFAGATQFVRPEDVAENIPCGPDLDKIVEQVSAFWEAGFTDVALVQIGDEAQDRFLDEAAGPLLEKLRSASGS
jgi:G6PDH family F420-dependent oxidoreductase